ncbi:hypothetical protein FO519_006021 [Halicephalobus sp. NKZ332]|nr:hypothetical protein FO519_006021 [Halicephalobus sp. NKZ332]
MSKSNEIIIVGSIVQDCISYAERFPKPGESIRGRDFKLGSGGKGANQCVQIAKLGGNAVMIGRVGNDMFGDSNLKSLSESGVNVELIEKSRTAPTATAAITVVDEGENSIVVTLGANLELSVEKINELESHIARSALLMCQFEIREETNLAAFKIAKKHNVITFYNAAPGSPSMRKDILEFTDILCTNENETEFIVGRELKSLEDFKKAAHELVSFGPKIIVITLGPKGVLVLENDELSHIEVPFVKAVDTTGAGDSFCGSLAFLLVRYREKSVTELSKIASKIASMSVQKHGTQSSYPTAEEVKKNGIEL